MNDFSFMQDDYWQAYTIVVFAVIFVAISVFVVFVVVVDKDDKDEFFVLQYNIKYITHI